MYERFTDRARKVMQLANQEAQRLNHEYIDPGHILIGVCKEGSGVACNVLKNLGVRPEGLLKPMRDKMTPGPDMVTMGKLPQTPAGKRVVEYAVAAARELGHNYVGTEHVLLGLLTEQGHESFGVLGGAGVTRERTIAEIKELFIKSKAEAEDELKTEESGVRQFGVWVVAMEKQAEQRKAATDRLQALEEAVKSLGEKIDRLLAKAEASPEPKKMGREFL